MQTTQQQIAAKECQDGVVRLRGYRDSDFAGDRTEWIVQRPSALDSKLFAQPEQASLARPQVAYMLLPNDEVLVFTGEKALKVEEILSRGRGSVGQKTSWLFKGDGQRVNFDFRKADSEVRLLVDDLLAEVSKVKTAPGKASTVKAITATAAAATSEKVEIAAADALVANLNKQIPHAMCTVRPGESFSISLSTGSGKTNVVDISTQGVLDRVLRALKDGGWDVSADTGSTAVVLNFIRPARTESAQELARRLTKELLLERARGRAKV